MKRLPTMKQLQYLVALADTRRFGRAAERCHITQSTLSAGIRDLELVLGTAVAERSNRRRVPLPPSSWRNRPESISCPLLSSFVYIADRSVMARPSC